MIVATLEEPSTRAPLNPLQVGKLLEAPDPQEKLYLRDVAILETMYACGLRPDELFTLEVGDIGFDAREIRVTFNGNTRTIPLGKAAREAIARYLEVLRPCLVERWSSDTLFVTHNGHRMNRASLRILIDKAWKRGGLPGAIVKLDTLRRCFLVHLLAAGANRCVVKDLLG